MPRPDAADTEVMDTSHELTLDQMREIVRLRRRHPRAEVLVHQKPWGLIVEARRSGHALELESFDWSGAVNSASISPCRSCRTGISRDLPPFSSKWSSGASIARRHGRNRCA